MKNKIVAVIAIVVLAVAGIWIAKGSGLKAPAPQAGVYCSQDGRLSDTMPIQSHRSYCIKSNSQSLTFAANTPVPYSFSIVDDRGNITKDFEVTHTKQMHVIVARKDLAYFQHVHPDFDSATGVFTLKDLTLPADGEYRIFADFSPVGVQKDEMGMPLAVTTSEDIKTGSSYSPQPIGTEEKSKTFDGMLVSLATHGTPTSDAENMLMFSLKDVNGKPVTDLQPYLGALGHSVILREGNLDFIHAHPMEDVSATQNGAVDFMVNFPEAGKYKVFTQFQRDGKVITTNFVLTVAQGMDMTMPGMNHSMH